MKEEKIILYDSPEAARLLTPEDLVKTPVWVFSHGNEQVITTKEHIARYAGCTHKTCRETGEIFPKEWVHSRTVRIKLWRERYNQLPQLEVNENTMFAFYDGEDVYDDEDELFAFRLSEELDDLGLVTIATPVNFRELTTEYWYDDAAQDCYLESPEIDDLILQLNRAVAAMNPAYYAISKARPTDEFLEGMKARYEEYRKDA